MNEHHSLSLPGVSELRKELCTRGWSRAVDHSLGACASCWDECLYLPKVGVWGREGVCVLTSKLQAGLDAGR